ncbi:MAG: hypothetical protein GX625_02825 [Clostridiaceae bacterium]|mgnify:CR=1 FL=1|jgi:hypothetical protein|nr:hypothetical protein [Clostridiaceae bacterium]
MDINEIKSLYAEFIGYLSQAPSEKDRSTINEPQIWEQYNKSIEKLSEYSGKDYSDFSIKVKNSSSGAYIQTVLYRSKLGGIISKLHAEYFDTLPEPFSGKPSIVINQNQQQNQQILFQLILDVQSKIDEKLPSLPEGSKEKTFLQKLKGSLSATTGVVDLLSKIFSLAKECGVPTEGLMKLFT